MSTTPIIQVKGITKIYGQIAAVDDLSLDIREGVCFGLLGPNGAGKTTLIEIIEDIIPPSRGEIFFQGQPRTFGFREQIGIMFQQTALLQFLTVEETLLTFKKLYRQSYDIEELIELCYLGDIRTQLNDKISGGQRQRLLLALALINHPQLLFLDEPSTGLDPQARRNLWDIIGNIKSQGKTIILTTHYMEEAQQLCDQIAIMDHGRIMAQGAPSALIEQHTQGFAVTLPVQQAERLRDRVALKMRTLADRVIFEGDDLNRMLKLLVDAGMDLSHIDVQPPNLETVFLNLTGRGLRD
jgi:ABC-2 type transport system ATP-binding protein